MVRTPSRRHGRRVPVAATLLATAALLVPAARSAEASVPIGNLPGWTQILHEEFSTPLNPRRWGVYSGQPGGNPHGMWSPSHVELHLSAARLRGYRENGRFVTAGMMLNSVPQVYGKYLVRAHFDRSVGIEQVMLLWPVDGGWPPEIDFSEGSSGSPTMATSHWSSNNQQHHAFAAVDMTKWHTYGVEWTPSRVTFTLDGRSFGTVTGAAVPHVPMSLALQTHATRPVGGITSAVPREVTEYVDWVSVYRYH